MHTTPPPEPEQPLDYCPYCDDRLGTIPDRRKDATYLICKACAHIVRKVEHQPGDMQNHG